MKKQRLSLHSAIGLALFLAGAMVLVKLATGWPS